MHVPTPTRDELNRIRTHTYRAVRETPLWHSETLSRMAGCSVYLKAELFQKTGSYKPRGMYWRLHQLSAEEKRSGVITYSSGNAGQALAYACRLMNVSCTVVIPQAASPVKADAIRGYGAELVSFGDNQQCSAHCTEVSQRRGLTFISPYDGLNLMLGHSGLGLEIIDRLPDVVAVFVGIGGGGMAGGLALAFNASNRPARLYGVEPSGAAVMSESLRVGHPVELKQATTIADGLCAPTVSTLGYHLIKQNYESVDTVEDSEIASAMKLLMSRAKLFAEPSGSAALAGLLKSRGRFKVDDKVVCIVSGGNMDLERLANLL